MIVALDVIALALVLADVHGPLRVIVVLVSVLVVPGWAVVGLLRLGHVALELALSMAVGLGLLVLLAQLLLSVNLWHLYAAQIGVYLASLPSLVWQALDGRRLTAEVRG